MAHSQTSPGRPRPALFRRLHLWAAARRTRADLAGLNDHMRADIGLSPRRAGLPRRPTLRSLQAPWREDW